VAALLPEEAPGWRRGVLIALACTLLTAFFFALRFPYDLFRAPLVAQLAALTGAQVEVGGVSGGLGLGGPSLVAEPVALRWPTGALELERASLRPAWSLSWLRGRPALYADLRAPAGRLAGTFWPGEPLGFAGGVSGLAIEQLPPEILAAAEGFALTGRLDADADLSYEGGALTGELELDLHDGAVSAPGSPLSIPFERFQAALDVDRAGAIRVESARLDGPMVAGSATGRIGLAADPTLDLQLDLQVPDPNLRGMIAPLGVRLDAEGRASVRLLGTLGQPVLR
jgi:type II secretion system protein N